MKHPRNSSTIQIEITNACGHGCSNCTRLCGHHKKPFFMDMDTFKKAVDSLEGYKGIVGTMGGEPTLHPNFELIAECLKERFKKHEIFPTDKLIIKDYPNYIFNKISVCSRVMKNGIPGLWTSATKNYYKHYEIIQEAYAFQTINLHCNESFHQPILISRKDYGVDDETWIKLRDNCDFQNQWSPSITPKGIFFCEIAAALDMLYDGHGGLPIEKGWWKKDVEQFESQFYLCELCGGALKTFEKFKRNANDQIDDISPTILNNLKKIGSPKVKNEKYDVFNYTINDSGYEGVDVKKTMLIDYAPNSKNRYGSSINMIMPQALECILVLDNKSVDLDQIGILIESISNKVDSLVIATNDKRCFEILKYLDIDGKNILFSIGGFGRILDNAINCLTFKDWVVVIDDIFEYSFPMDKNNIKSFSLNPGVCYINQSQKTYTYINANARSLKRNGKAIYSCESGIDGIVDIYGRGNVYYFNLDYLDNDMDMEIRRGIYTTEVSLLNDCDLKGEMVSALNDSAINIKSGDKIILLLPCSIYAGIGYYRLFKSLGLYVHILIYEGNAKWYLDMIPHEDIKMFKNNERFVFDSMKPELDTIKSHDSYKGFVMVSNTYNNELSKDHGFEDIIRIGKYISDKHIASFNGHNRRIIHLT